MKLFYATILFFVIFFSFDISAQTSMSSGTLNQCGGTYLDPAGSGNYTNNANITQTICSPIAGQCITLQFTSFNLENNYDFLRIYNGTSAGAPLLATLTGTTVPGNITSTTGCLTLVFTSDGSVNSTGWVANVICSPCGSPPPPPPGPTIASDCSGAVNICTNSSFQIDPNGSGNVVEFTSGSVTNPSINPGSANSGCLLSGELNSTWMVVNIATSGTLEFSFGADGGSGCLDWIMWPYNGTATCNQIISNSLAPIRCNWNGLCETFTGIATPLPSGGDASNFEPELNVLCGQQYLICLSNYSSQTTSVPLNFFGSASVSCTTFTPITVNSATICPGATATLTASGGNTYSWSPGGQTTATINVSPASTTTYTVTGTGACGTGTATSTVTVLPANDPSCITSCTATATNTGPYCAGATIQLNGTGGGTYSWTGPNGFTSTLQNPVIPSSTTAASGTYTLTINLSGCIATATTTVIVNPLPTVTAPDAAICLNGSTTLNASGANTYTWSPTTGLSAGSGATVTANPTSTTNYTLTGTSLAGCVNTDVVTVTVNPLPTVNAGSPQTVCAGTSVTLAATGASTYSWNNGLTQGVAFTPTTTTTYTVTGTSAAGCTNTANVTVTVNPIPNVSAGPDVSICSGGATTLTATGATTYSWTPGGQTTASITVSPSSTTTYTVVGTSLGCTSSDAVVVSVLSNAPINAGPDVAICAGQNTVLTATGGTTYNWNNGLGSGNGFTVFPVATTTYTVVGTDANGCSGTDAIVVTVNPLPTVNAGLDQTVCEGSSVTLTAVGASTYSWDNGVTNGVAFIPASTLIYSVTGTTAAGCIGTDNVMVMVNPLPNTNAGVDQTVCAGTQVTLNATGAGTYSWDNGVFQGVPFTPAVTTTYTVTGTSAEGCTNQDQVLVTVNPLPVVDAGNDVTICDGAPVTLTATGANTYSWNNGVTNGVSFTPSLGSTTYTVTGTSAAGCIGTDQVIVNVNPNPTPLINGPIDYCTGSSALLSTSQTYNAYNWSTGATSATINATAVNNPITVSVIDANGCQGTSPAFTVTENTIITANFTVTICEGATALIHGVNQTVAGTYSQTFVSASGCDSISNVTLNVNPLPTVNAGIDQAVCIGSSVILSASGAATYTWDNAVQNGVTFTPAATNTYTVTGTSAAGCVNTDQVVVTVNPLPNVSAGPDLEACIGESLTLTATGASIYSWDNGVLNGVSFVPTGTSSYTVNGTDINGCVNTDQVNVTVNPSPIINAGPDQTLCQGNSVTLTATGGVSYSWDNAVTNGVAFTPALGTTSYTVNGTDQEGCVGSDQIVVTVNALPNVNAGNDQTLCVGGTITLTASGAQTYNWSNGIVNGSTFVPSAGTVNYSVSGTDQNGCVNTDELTVTVNPLPDVNAGGDQSVCEGTSVTLNAGGASTYLWSGNVQNGISFVPPVGTNTYTVTGTDVNGCVNTDEVIVVVDPIPTVFAGNDIVICEGESVSLTASGASVYTWDNGLVNGSPFIPTVGTTVYTVTGTTNAGCTDSDELSVTVNPSPLVSFTPDNTLGCAPLTVNFTNQTAGASNCVWTFSNGAVITGCGTVPVTFSQSGCYDATLTTTVNGCTSSFTSEDIVCVEEVPVAAFVPSSNTLSMLNTSVFFENLSTGATSYFWDFGYNSQTSTLENPTHLYPAEEGEYTVMLIASSPLGCSDTTYSIIQIYEELIFYVPNTFTPDNDNFNPEFKPIFTSGFDPLEYNLLIFNRWGEVIFESNNSEVGWDGSYGSNGEIEMCQDGTYTWKIEFKVSRFDERKRVVGHVNLLR